MMTESTGFSKPANSVLGVSEIDASGATWRDKPYEPNSRQHVLISGHAEEEIEKTALAFILRKRFEQFLPASRYASTSCSAIAASSRCWCDVVVSSGAMIIRWQSTVSRSTRHEQSLSKMTAAGVPFSVRVAALR